MSNSSLFSIFNFKMPSNHSIAKHGKNDKVGVSKIFMMCKYLEQKHLKLYVFKIKIMITYIVIVMPTVSAIQSCIAWIFYVKGSQLGVFADRL